MAAPMPGLWEVPSVAKAKPKYPSKFGGDATRLVTAAQWVAELMCERLARQEGKTLPLQFWKLPPWDRIYRRQVGLANRLIKMVDPEGDGTGEMALSRALKTEAGRRLYSLAAPHFVPLVEKAHRELAAEAAADDGEGEAAEEMPPPPSGPPRPPFVRRSSLLARLRSCDGSPAPGT